jgi:hypothetical protein
VRLQKKPAEQEFKVSGNITAPSATICRARMRLEQAETIITTLSAAYGRISALFRRMPAAKVKQGMTVRRAWLRESA